jgi:hypothetical protein
MSIDKSRNINIMYIKIYVNPDLSHIYVLYLCIYNMCVYVCVYMYVCIYVYGYIKLNIYNNYIRIYNSY